MVRGASDVELADNGEFIIARVDVNRVSVVGADGGRVERQWADGYWKLEPGKFMGPAALAVCNGELYVLDQCSPRVQVFV